MAVSGGRGFSGREGGVVTPFPVGWGERRLAGSDDGGADLSVGDTSVGGDGGHEWGGGGGHGRRYTKGGGVLGLRILRNRQIGRRRVRVGIWLYHNRFCKIKSQRLWLWLWLRLRLRGRNWRRRMRRCATKASVAGAIQQVDDLFELGDSEVGDFRAVKVVEIKTVVVCVRRRRRSRRDLRRKDANQMLHTLQPSGSCFLNRHILFHPNICQIYCHSTTLE